MPDPAPHPTPGPSNAQTFKYATFEQVLDDLSCRFILNLPDEELRSIERVCFQVEQAHWFYEDFVRDVNPNLPSFPLRKFSFELFHYCPMLQHWSQVHEQAFDQFMAYKLRVPVCGAIMLNDKLDKCVLVKGYKSSSGWGFPKGKINQNERESDCAAREVLEETGYDISSKMKETDYLNIIVREQSITLYIVSGVPEDFEFKTRTRKEISKIEWFKLSDLPTWKRKRDASGRFYLITPFIGQLKEFISRKRKEGKTKKDGGAITQIITKTTNGVKIDSIVTVEPRSSSDECATPTKESSSLSSGNVGPSTPSPERSLFFNPDSNSRQKPIVLDSMDELDPHLANLLTNLSLSANGVPDGASTAKSINAVTTSASESAGSERASIRAPSPSVESVSSASVYTTAPSASNSTFQFPTSSRESVKSPQSQQKSLSHKRSKHIALLDSVVEDIELAGSSDPTNQQKPLLQSFSNSMYPTNGAVQPSLSSFHAPYSYPYNQPGVPPPHIPGLLPPGHQQVPSSINFPNGRGVKFPPQIETYQHPPQNMIYPHNISSIPRPLTSQSQVQMYPGSFPPAPNGLGVTPFPPHQGFQANNPPRAPPPGTQQSQLLALLSPRSRAISHPHIPQQGPRHPQNPPGPGPGHVPMRESVHNAYLNGHPQPNVLHDIPPLLLSSPLNRGVNNFPMGVPRRDIAPNPKLLSILNGGAPQLQTNTVPPPRPML